MKIKVVIIALSIFCVLSCGYNGKINKGNEIVTKIEKFKSEKGRLPNSLNEIGIAESESGPIYYKKESESKFILWFGKELGESMTYDSQTKEWK